jgi:hypothetical protein
MEDTMAQDNLVEIHVHVATEEGGRDTLGWTQTAVDAVEQVGAELSSEGVPTRVQRAAGSEAGARGVGVDDLLIGVAANAISAFIFRVVQDLHSRFARHQNMPKAIVLEAEGRRLQLPGDVPIGAVADQIREWAESMAEPHQLTITVVR